MHLNTYLHHFTSLHIHLKEQSEILKYSQDCTKTLHSDSNISEALFNSKELLISMYFHLVPFSMLSKILVKSYFLSAPTTPLSGFSSKL